MSRAWATGEEEDHFKSQKESFNVVLFEVGKHNTIVLIAKLLLARASLAAMSDRPTSDHQLIGIRGPLSTPRDM